nr:glyoxalase superfamily protein [Frankia sp. Cas3]
MDEEAIPILHVTNTDRAVAWYTRLGFVKEWEHRFEPGIPAFVCVASGRARLFLSEHSGDARPDTRVYLRVPNVDVIAAELNADVENTPWNTREFEVRDPDGNRLRVGSPPSPNVAGCGAGGTGGTGVAGAEALRDAERCLQRAQLASDVAALDRLIDDRLVFTGPDGRHYTKQDDLHVHGSGGQAMTRVDEEDLAVLVVGDTGVTWFLGTLEGIMDGEPFVARVRYTRTWVHDSNGWRLIAAHVSLADGDSAGR